MGDPAATPAAGDDTSQCLTAKLIEEFRSVLDEPVILAIVSDYDLTHDFDTAHSILLGISENVAIEEASGFNSNGLNEDPADLEWPASSVSASASRGLTDTSVTDFSDTLSDRFEALELPKDVNVATLDEDGKIAELKLIFPTLRPYDVSHTLKKVGGDFTQACEDLLNLQYLEENGLRAKGIEGAFRPDELVGYKKGRLDSPVDRPAKNRLDIAYSLKPLNLSEDDTSSITSPTSSISKGFGGTPTRSRPISMSTNASLGIASAPVSPRIKSSDWQTVTPKQSQRKTYSELAGDASNAQETTASAFAAAQRAWRRGRSDILFRPVAGVYAERAREHLEAYRAVDSRKYEALVNEQSSGSKIDLHGVPVADGVRIALERTQTWWATLGEYRAKRAREEGFVVVTGLGNHSSSGVSRLRQEVGAALKREGWRVRTETGQFVVTGRT